MAARVMSQSLCLMAVFSGAAVADRCGVGCNQMNAPCIGNGKCFDESDDVRIERPQSGRLQAAPLAAAIFAFAYLFHPAQSRAAFGSLKGHGGCGRANGSVLVELDTSPTRFGSARPAGREVLAACRTWA